MNVRHFSILVVAFCLPWSGAFAFTVSLPGSYVDSLYKTIYIAPESGYSSVGGLCFDPCSTSIDGYYDKVYFVNRSDDYETRGLYLLNIYDGTYEKKALTDYDDPFDCVVDNNDTAYVCYSYSMAVWKIEQLSTTLVATRLFRDYDMSGDDDPVSIDLVPEGFGYYDAGRDLVLFDQGVNDNNDEAIFIVDDGIPQYLWSDGVVSGDNDIRGATNNYDGYAYFARMTIPSDDSGSGTKYYISRVNYTNGGVEERMFLNLAGATIDSNDLDDAIAVNPVDGSVWIAVSGYNGDANDCVIYRIDAAGASPINTYDYMADTTIEILFDGSAGDSMNVGMNSMAFSPDGKFLIIGNPDGRDTLYVFATEPLMPPVNCADAIQKGYGLEYDLDSDCRVDSNDLGLLVSQWLECFDPEDANCPHPW